MKRTLLVALFLLPYLFTFAGSGGPDAYGYTWKDSDEPDGPTYQWTDITQTGIQVTGLGDDNVVGPFILSTNFNFYWYQVKKVWVGSNGYISFGNSNIAAAFPLIPTPGGGNDFIAGMMSDLNFSGATNPAECWLFDDTTKTIVSYIDVPFWDPGLSWSGSNTFQIVLDKQDSTITIHYQDQQGLTQSNDIAIGIENLTGDIGLQHSADTYPLPGYSIRFYNPSQPLIDIADATASWVTDDGSLGMFVKKDGPDIPMIANVKNTGNLSLSSFNTDFVVRNQIGQIVASDSWPVDSLEPAIDTTIFYPSSFTSADEGIYSFSNTITGIFGEFTTTNNTKIQEVIIVDTTQLEMELGYTGGQDDGIGIAWNGGDGGIAVHYEPPYYPAFAASTRFRIVGNIGNVGFYSKIWDDDGPDGGPGTLLDSVFVPSTDVMLGGTTVVPLANPFFINDGGVYVEWQMGGPNINIGRDIQPPFSFRTYEVLGGTWAEYRDRETEDFYIHLVLTQPPVWDGGVPLFFGLIDGSMVSQPTVVRTWIKNYGNVNINNVDVSYQYNNDPVVTEQFSGGLIPPGDSILYTFTEQLVPNMNGNGQLCAWTNLAADADLLNDTACVDIEMITSVAEWTPLQFNMWPDPANEQLNILLDNQVNDLQIEVRDLLGGLILSERRNVSAGQATSLNLNGLAEGAYLLLLRSTDNVASKRFLKVGR